MTVHLGYNREPGVLSPPLGGGPWLPDFNDRLQELVQGAEDEFHIELEKQSRYGTKHTRTDDVYCMAQNLALAWKTATRHHAVESVGMFEVRLLSAVLVARYNIVPAMQAESRGETTRPSISYLNDLRTAARVLALYTGADPEEIENSSQTQTDLMAYLGNVRSTLG